MISITLWFGDSQAVALFLGHIKDQEREDRSLDQLELFELSDATFRWLEPI
jgi:hypothetical protein